MRRSCGGIKACLMQKSFVRAFGNSLRKERSAARFVRFFRAKLFFALHVAILRLVLRLTGGNFGDFDGSAALFEEGFKVGGVQPYGTSNYPFIIEVYFTS